MGMDAGIIDVIIAGRDAMDGAMLPATPISIEAL